MKRVSLLISAFLIMAVASFANQANFDEVSSTIEISISQLDNASLECPPDCEKACCKKDGDKEKCKKECEKKCCKKGEDKACCKKKEDKKCCKKDEKKACCKKDNKEEKK